MRSDPRPARYTLKPCFASAAITVRLASKALSRQRRVRPVGADLVAAPGGYRSPHVESPGGRCSGGAVVPRPRDDCFWAIASARRDREIVSSARLILVISKRVSDLSADLPDACSRAAGQLTRRDARLLQSPRSGTVAGGHALAAGIAQKQSCRADYWFAPGAAVRRRTRAWSLLRRSGSEREGPADCCSSSLARAVQSAHFCFGGSAARPRAAWNRQWRARPSIRWL